jgi:hypothetical protein
MENYVNGYNQLIAEEEVTHVNGNHNLMDSRDHDYSTSTGFFSRYRPISPGRMADLIGVDFNTFCSCRSWLSKPILML